jgi:hypothetical protein
VDATLEVPNLRDTLEKGAKWSPTAKVLRSASPFFKPTVLTDVDDRHGHHQMVPVFSFSSALQKRWSRAAGTEQAAPCSSQGQALGARFRGHYGKRVRVPNVELTPLATGAALMRLLMELKGKKQIGNCAGNGHGEGQRESNRERLHTCSCRSSVRSAVADFMGAFLLDV